MAGKSVATKADVKTTPSTQTPYPPADPLPAGGAWTAGPVTVTSYAKLTIGGQPAISEAKCTFSFTGTQTIPGPPVVKKPVSGTDDVTLSAAALGTTKVQGGEQQVLRDGDQSNTSPYGNVISISASEKLTSG